MRQYRPALVVARYADQAGSDRVWVLMITSAIHRRWNGDVDISDLDVAGLPAPSIVRTAKVATLEVRDTDRIGNICVADRVAVASQIAHLLACVMSMSA